MYKKIIYFFIPAVFILLLFSYRTQAQYAFWGFKAGVQANKIISLSFDSKMTPGFNVGIFGNFILSKQFALQHELLYTQRGFGGTTKDSFEVKGSLPYIELPWCLYYNVNKAFHLQFGLQPGIYVFFKPPQRDSSDFSKYNVNPIDLAVIIGGGVILDNNFLFGARLTVSTGQTFNTEEFGGRNVTLQAYMGYAVNRKVKNKKKAKKK
jgi:Outer membrane protein beta-barrel domain